MGQRDLTQWTNKEYVCKWDVTNQVLTSDQKAKAQKFIDNDCIVFDGKDYWCKPILGYNKTSYTIKLINGEWKCNCQWNTTKHRLCSHILAVFLWIDKSML